MYYILEINKEFCLVHTLAYVPKENYKTITEEVYMELKIISLSHMCYKNNLVLFDHLIKNGVLHNNI